VPLFGTYTKHICPICLVQQIPTHIAELEEQLEAETEKMPSIDNVSLIRVLMI
jgi:hypothetical protein